jgi:ABC-type dipeptide/oligopeptide/nickel transport system ATPase component
MTATPPQPEEPLLWVRDLSVRHCGQGAGGGGGVEAVRGASFELAMGEILGIVGESGSGKTQLLLSLLGLTERGATVTGSARFRGEELIGMREARLRTLRGERIAMIFQDPMTALNPYLRVGSQLTEVLAAHRRMRGRAAQRRAQELLEAVHINEPRHRLQQFPHELSGGMRQRVMIAMALLCEPQILLADEPTTALDVTVQAQILALLRELRERRGTAIILVTHDFGVVAETADRVLVMQQGQIIEQADVQTLFDAPREPYTAELLRATRAFELTAEDVV